MRARHRNSCLVTSCIFIIFPSGRRSLHCACPDRSTEYSHQGVWLHQSPVPIFFIHKHPSRNHSISISKPCFPWKLIVSSIDLYFHFDNLCFIWIDYCRKQIWRIKQTCILGQQYLLHVLGANCLQVNNCPRCAVRKRLQDAKERCWP